MKINEIFYSIQGEGSHTGEAAIFVRFSGCNLKCEFCDTHHQTYIDLSEDEICAEIAKYSANLVVITGGEPALQLNDSLVNKIHLLGKSVAIETNGTRELPLSVDWVVVSPKTPFVPNAEIKAKKIDEIKLIFDGKMTEEEIEHYHRSYNAQHYFLQPCDVGCDDANNEIISKLVEYVKQHTEWKISLQTHKMLKVR